jgi:integrase/recombinase XerD
LQFFLCTGAREKEPAHATWRDVDLEERTFSITEKREARLQFTTKDHEEVIVPLPDFMVALLFDRRKRYPTGRLIFPGKDVRVEGHFLRALKKLALRGGLNGGHCTNKLGKSCLDHPVCDYRILHRFRKAFATRHSEAGVLVRTIRRWLRHSGLDTTLKYLASSDDQTTQTRDRINSAFTL